MRVARKFINTTKEFIILNIENEKIYVTKYHTIYTNRGLIKAEELELSDKLYNINNEEVNIDSIEIEKLNEDTNVYNFEVEKNHKET